MGAQQVATKCQQLGARWQSQELEQLLVIVLLRIVELLLCAVRAARPVHRNAAKVALLAGSADAECCGCTVELKLPRDREQLRYQCEYWCCKGATPQASYN